MNRIKFIVAGIVIATLTTLAFLFYGEQYALLIFVFAVLMTLISKLAEIPFFGIFIQLGLSFFVFYLLSLLGLALTFIITLMFFVYLFYGLVQYLKETLSNLIINVSEECEPEI